MLKYFDVVIILHLFNFSHYLTGAYCFFFFFLSSFPHILIYDVCIVFFFDILFTWMRGRRGLIWWWHLMNTKNPMWRPKGQETLMVILLFFIFVVGLVCIFFDLRVFCEKILFFVNFLGFLWDLFNIFYFNI